MLNRIIEISLNNRLLVIVMALALIAVGVVSVLHLPMDAFPDTTPVQVQINTVAPSLSPLEIEQQITFPVELAIGGLPGLQTVRSLSKFGLSQVVVIFDDETDIYFSRQLIMERLQTAELPEGSPRPGLGPVSTGLGEVFHYLVESDSHTLTEITTAHNWIVKPKLRQVSGVAEVNTWGGFEKQFHVLIDARRLIKHGLSFSEVFEALERNNRNVGGGLISPREGESILVHGLGLVASVSEIENIIIEAVDGVPIRIRDVADVEIGHEIRRAVTTAQGNGESVLGLGFMLMGENSRDITSRLKDKLEDTRKTLPPGMTVRIVYDRTELVDKVLHTVEENLLVGALLVIAVLFIFMGNLRAGLIVAAAIPLAMLCAFSAMLQAGIAGSLMSLGAIDFGLVVDSSVIMIENSVRRLAGNSAGRPKLDVVREAAIEVRKPTMFGELIIMIVYLPILTLQGIEGKLFRPMALTVIFALAGSMVISLTLMPALASLVLSSRPKEKELFVIRFFKWLYRPAIRLVLKIRLLVLLAVAGLVVWVAGLAMNLGSEFIPRLDEGSVVINTVRLAGVSIEESARYGTQIEKVLLEEFSDEIENIWTRTGTPEVATDPMGMEVSDVFITLKPREQWKKAKTQEGLVMQMSWAMQTLPGMRAIFTQPIEMRVNEMIAGIRTDLGVKIFGDDFDKLVGLAEQVETILKQATGSADVVTEQITGQPVLQVRVRPDDLARRGISAEDVLSVVECIGGRHIGEIREGQMRFGLVARLRPEYCSNKDAISKILIPTADGQRIPLYRVADVDETTGPTVINREWGKRRIVVSSNVRGRDIGSFVNEIRGKIRKQVKFPPGYSIDFGGQFENLERARERLMIVVPLALALILFLLYTSTRSVVATLIIFTGAPFASMGGIVALWLRDMPFTISAGVGFVAVSGVAMLNGLVMLSTIRRLVAEGASLNQAIEEGALLRLRPVLMTALVAGLGFVPMALNTGVGAEVQRPLATVVIGGVISDNLLTLLVLPVLYSLFGRRTESEAETY